MISKEDFMFTIGYDGSTAVVDGQAKRKYGSLSASELASVGLFRAAYCAALRSGDPADMDALASAYNAAAGTSYGRDFNFGRLFGAYPVEAKKAKQL